MKKEYLIHKWLLIVIVVVLSSYSVHSILPAQTGCGTLDHRTQCRVDPQGTLVWSSSNIGVTIRQTIVNTNPPDSSGGPKYFFSTRTREEWDSFYNARTRLGVTIEPKLAIDCGLAGGAYTLGCGFGGSPCCKFFNMDQCPGYYLPNEWRSTGWSTTVSSTCHNHACGHSEATPLTHPWLPTMAVDSRCYTEYKNKAGSCSNVGCNFWCYAWRTEIGCIKY